MLFSKKDVVDVLARFECAWESVRPVPKIEIDFGNGHKLTRTLNGNVAGYFAFPDGRVLDIAPGVMTREDFLARAAIAEDALRRLDGPDRERRTARWHLERQLASSPRRLPRRADMSKMAVERPVKESLRADTDYNKAERDARLHELLRAEGLKTPAQLTKRVYKEVLDVDLDDPYLGLAPYVLGGEGGRH